MTVFPIGLHRPVEHAGPPPARADVVIIGAGIIGVMSAWYLAERGLRVVVVEKGRVAGEQSSRNWGWIRQMGRDPAELPIMMQANRLWRDLQAETGEDLGLVQCGLTYLARDQAALARFQRWLDAVAGSGVDSRMLTADAVRKLLPGCDIPVVGGMHTASDMRAEPWVAVPALARGAIRKGAVIVEGCAARVLDVQAGRVVGLWTEAGHIAAPEVLVAGGAWSSLFLRRHGITLPQLSVRASALATGPLPEIYAGGVADDDLAFCRRQDGGYTLALSESHDFWIGPDAFRHLRAYLPQLRLDPFGRRYRAMAPRGFPDAWGTKRSWRADEETPFERMRVLDPAPNMNSLAAAQRRFAAVCPGLGPITPSVAWAGMIDVLPDEVPVADRAPLRGLSICTGMCGHGFGIGPGFGRIMADLITGSAPGHDLSRFRLSRFSDGTHLQIGPHA
jgi:glycine/D-amino acid oxidase-like deaminating enzyme